VVQPRLNTLDRSNHDNRVRIAYAPEFRVLLKEGDVKLNFHSRNILASLLGRNNHPLTDHAYDYWISNDNWKVLAILYRLDLYLNWIPPSLDRIRGTATSFESVTAQKFYADLWEAYWACLFFEREMWNDQIFDLLLFLRRLLQLCTLFVNIRKVFYDATADCLSTSLINGSTGIDKNR
jgi:hypothetical protein